MARRVRSDANQFVVGPPGINCLAAAEQDLIFSNRQSAYNGVYLNGVLPASAFSESSSVDGVGATVYLRTGVVNFGKTFPSPPRVLVGSEDIRNDQHAFVERLNFGRLLYDGIPAHTAGANLSMYYAVSTTQLTVQVYYSYKSGNGYNRNVPCPYTVFLA